MDGTWRPRGKTTKYIVCQSCKNLVKRSDAVREGYCFTCIKV